MKTTDPKTLPHQSDPLRNEAPNASGPERAQGEAHDLSVRDLPESHLPAVYRKAAALAGSPLEPTPPAPTRPIPFHPRRETEEPEDFIHRFRSAIVKRLKKIADKK